MGHGIRTIQDPLSTSESDQKAQVARRAGHFRWEGRTSIDCLVLANRERDTVRQAYAGYDIHADVYVAAGCHMSIATQKAAERSRYLRDGASP